MYNNEFSEKGYFKCLKGFQRGTEYLALGVNKVAIFLKVMCQQQWNISRFECVIQFGVMTVRTADLGLR